MSFYDTVRCIFHDPVYLVIHPQEIHPSILVPVASLAAWAAVVVVCLAV